MNESENIKNELKELNSSLAERKIVDTFKVEDGYFDQLSDTILSKTNTSQFIIKMFWNLNPHFLKASAVLMLLIVGGYFIFNTVNNNKSKKLSLYSYDYIIENIEEDIIIEYLSYNSNYIELRIDEYIIDDIEELYINEEL